MQYIEAINYKEHWHTEEYSKLFTNDALTKLVIGYDTNNSNLLMAFSAYLRGVVDFNTNIKKEKAHCLAAIKKINENIQIFFQ